MTNERHSRRTASVKESTEYTENTEEKPQKTQKINHKFDELARKGRWRAGRRGGCYEIAQER